MCIKIFHLSSSQSHDIYIIDTIATSGIAMLSGGSSKSSRNIVVLVECWLKTECKGLLQGLLVVVVNYHE